MDIQVLHQITQVCSALAVFVLCYVVFSQQIRLLILRRNIIALKDGSKRLIVDYKLKGVSEELPYKASVSFHTLLDACDRAEELLADEESFITRWHDRRIARSKLGYTRENK